MTIVTDNCLFPNGYFSPVTVQEPFKPEFRLQLEHVFIF